jgi:hypothetical protein
VQPFLILFGAGFTIAVCMALGLIVGQADSPARAVRAALAARRRSLFSQFGKQHPIQNPPCPHADRPAPAADDLAVQFVTGAAVLSLIVFALCAVRLAYPWVFLGVGAACLVCSRIPVRLPIFKFRPILLAFLPFFVLYFFHAMAPEASPDGAGYHLTLIMRYLQAHGFVRITDNFYAAFPAAVEMLFLHAFAFGRHSAAALVHLAFLVALTAQVYRRSPAAALLVFASPVVGIDAASAYNDVALAAVAFTLFNLLERWQESRSPRLLAAIGLLTGFAVAAKFTAWLAVPWAIGWLALKSRRSAVIAAALAGLVVAPWLIKNWLWLENPLAPFFNRLFPNPYVLASFEDTYRQNLQMYHLTSRWQIPWDVTTRGTLSGLLGPVFLLAPVALLALRSREGRRVLLAAVVFGANYFSNIGTRFLIPPLPFVALAMALGLAMVPRLPLALALIHAVISWPALIPKYASPYSWHLTKIPWREALRLKPEGPYIATRLPSYPIDRLIEEKTTPGSTIFTFTPIPEAYTSRRIRVEFQAADNKLTGAILWTASQPEYAPIWRLRWTFPRQALKGIRVVQTGTGPEQWSVHELRLFDGTRELPRSPAWRLRANPYPWTVQNAFDNSPVTFWLASETIRPGQFIQIEFHEDETADSVLIESAPNQSSIRLKLEKLDGRGQWVPLADAPAIYDVPRPLGLRRAAAEEAKRRGNDYLLIFPGNAGAEDYRRNADLWGIRFVGEAAGARLYELPQF